MNAHARPPRAVQAAMEQMGDNLRMWRVLNNQSQEALAHRAGVSLSTLRRLEQGQGATLENLLRVARTVPVMEEIVTSTDPFQYDRGRSLAVKSPGVV